MSAVLVEPMNDAEPIGADDHLAGWATDLCPACGHPEFLHETLLTPIASFLICHVSTPDGECFRARHSRGIPFGACRRDLV